MVELARFKGNPILAKNVCATALAADVPLSFWGGFDPVQGTIIDQRHPLVGEIAAGRVLIIPGGRGSCSGSGVLFEAIHNHVAPAAILLSQIDPIVGLGCILGHEVYGRYPALVVLAEADRRKITTGDEITIDEQGWITVNRQ
jgi:predicted aconitase with swiveling domain